MLKDCEKLNKQGVIFFDLDDTLVEKTNFFIDNIKNSFSEIINAGFDKENREKLVERYLEKYSKKLNREEGYENLFVEYLDDEVEVSKFVQVAIDAEEKFFEKHYIKYKIPRLKDVLEKFSQNFILGIVTEGLTENQREKINKLNINRFFNQEHVWISEERNFVKNDEFYEMLFNKYKEEYFENVEPVMWMIGDREGADIAPAKAAGFNTIRVRTGANSVDLEHSKADVITHCVTDMLKLKLI